MNEEEKARRAIEKARKPEKPSKNDDLISKIWTSSLATIIVLCVFLLMLFIPIVLLYVSVGDLFVGYDGIYLHYIYPLFKFLKKDAPLIGIVCLIAGIVGYFLIFKILISWTRQIKNPDDKSLVIVGCILFIIISGALYYFAYNKLSSKEALTSVKLTSVENVINTLVAKTHDKKQMYDDLTKKIKESTDTVNALTQGKGYKSFNEAQEDQEIINELQAIQKALAYKKFTLDDWTMTEANIIKLRGSKKQLELDIIVLAGLNEEQLEALISGVDIVIGEIEPTAGELVVNKDTRQIPIEEIWRKYIEPATTN